MNKIRRLQLKKLIQQPPATPADGQTDTNPETHVEEVTYEFSDIYNTETKEEQTIVETSREFVRQQSSEQQPKKKLKLADISTIYLNRIRENRLLKKDTQ